MLIPYTKKPQGKELESDTRVMVKAHRANAHNRNVIEAYRAQHPLCQWCDRRPTAEIHHIRPVAERGASLPSNLMAACEECHKTLKDTPQTLQLKVKALREQEREVEAV